MNEDDKSRQEVAESDTKMSPMSKTCNKRTKTNTPKLITDLYKLLIKLRIVHVC